MKKLVLCLLIIAGFAHLSYAAFQPSVCKLAAPEIIQYDFDGTEFKLPVTLSGAELDIVFCVFTKDMASSIKKIRNGHLGWHYVNNIDTCLYVSGVTPLTTGQNTIIWNGNNDDGDMVPSGEYTYYVWGYNSITPRLLACKFFGPRSGQAGHFQQYDENNNALTVPIYYPPAAAIPQIAKENGGYDGTTNPGVKIRSKWILGSDPVDTTLIETTAYMGWNDCGKIAFMPGDHKYFFVQNYILKALIPDGLHHVMKYKWTPNGLSEQVMEFGEDGMFTVKNTSASYSGPISDNVSSLWIINGDNSYPESYNPEALYYVDPDTGSLLREYDFSWLWWDPAEIARALETGDKYHGGPTYANFSDGRIYNSGWSFCLKHCIDPYQEDDEDVTLWYNGNGDYIGDRFFEPDRGAKAWFCSAGSGAPWPYDYAADKNHFSIFSSYDLGALSFGLIAPDGTGVKYFALPGETAAIKYGQLFVDNGSAFDGIYCDNTADETMKTSLWYVAHDSIKGILTASSVSVDEASPAAFSVAQNAPNPFNPSTTISFTIPQAGTVSVDVFSVSGQKVATVANEFMNAGSHSVTWEADGLSAGVYFYTVKSGEFSRTMKMTLLK